MRKFHLLTPLLMALAYAIGLFSWAIAPTAPAFADDPNVRDHRGAHGYVQIVIKRITVHDDLDWGDGDIRISAHVRSNAEPCPLYLQWNCGARLVESASANFSASDGQTVTLNRVTPGPGDTILNPAVTMQAGVTIAPGHWYGLTIRGVEVDPAEDDSMGFLDANLLGDDGKIRYGTFTERGQGQCEHIPVRVEFCPVGVPAAFSVEYEIRPTPLPDLQPTAFRVASDVPGDRDDLICFTVRNRGVKPSEPFRVNIGIDSTAVLAQNINAAALAAGETREQCTGARIPDSGKHPVSVRVDPDDTQPEVDDTNNELIVGLDRTPAGQTRPQTGPVVASTETGGGTQADDGPVIVIHAATPTPSTIGSRSTAPDLTVSAIKVNGQAPDGKNDCKDGKNAVTVAVKNGGAADAESFVARLVVDGNQGGAVDLPVTGLKAGQEREVSFEAVRLAKGEHKLTATMDPAGSLTETNTDNNSPDRDSQLPVRRLGSATASASGAG